MPIQLRCNHVITCTCYMRMQDNREIPQLLCTCEITDRGKQSFIVCGLVSLTWWCSSIRELLIWWVDLMNTSHLLHILVARDNQPFCLLVKLELLSMDIVRECSKVSVTCWWSINAGFHSRACWDSVPQDPEVCPQVRPVWFFEQLFELGVFMSLSIFAHL